MILQSHFNTINLVKLIGIFYLQPKFRFAPYNPHFIFKHIHTLTYWSELIYIYDNGVYIYISV